MPSKVCFVIAPIGEPDSDIRKRSDQVLKHVIGPAVKERGFEAIRADQIAEPGIIASQVIQHVVDDPLVVADLTGRNPNVFYELAIRHAIRKPLIQLIHKGEQIPFDVAGMRTIPIDHRDLDSVEQTRVDIIKQIDSMEKGDASVDTPISVAIQLQTLRQSDDPLQRSLADLLSAVGDLRTAIGTIEERLASPAYFPKWPYKAWDAPDSEAPTWSGIKRLLVEKADRPQLSPEQLKTILHFLNPSKYPETDQSEASEGEKE